MYILFIKKKIQKMIAIKSCKNIFILFLNFFFQLYQMYKNNIFIKVTLLENK